MFKASWSFQMLIRFKDPIPKILTSGAVYNMQWILSCEEYTRHLPLRSGATSGVTKVNQKGL